MFTNFLANFEEEISVVSFNTRWVGFHHYWTSIEIRMWLVKCKV